MADKGQTVKVHYKGTLDDGTVFDSSEGREPLAFELGGGQVIPGFDTAVAAMAVGETRTVTIPSAEAYGPSRPEMFGEIPLTHLPEEIAPEVGMTLHMRTPQGPLPIKIVEVLHDRIKVDGNHPLAGQNLTFELTLVEAG